MRNLKIVFALVFVSVFMLTSCQKDQMEGIKASEKSTITADGDNLSGEELPAIESYSTEEIDQMRQTQITSFAKEMKLGDMKFTATDATASSRSRTITDIACGATKSGTTRGETNTVNMYEGADKVYLLELDKAGEVDFKLSQMRSDLDLFITEVVEDNYGRELIGAYLGTSNNGGNADESISIDLEKGKYFVIVETYEFGSDFELSIECENQGGSNPGSPNDCEDYQGLSTSYDYGVSEQSPHWNLWTSNANDGLVLLERSGMSNKVVKFDYRRFGYQDAVRDIIGLPLSSGYYFMSFDLFVADNSVAEMLTEKTAQYGQEQGFKLKVKNEQLIITHKDQTYTANTSIPSDTWHKVSMAFDLRENEITVLINGVRIIMRANAKKSSRYNGRKSIQGINFYGDESNSKFHVDNVCVEEVEGGYDSPIMIMYAGEVIDLR